MIGVLILLAGYGLGVLHCTASAWARRRFLDQPAVTPRAIARVRRHNRLDLRHLRTAREAGVRIERFAVDDEGRIR